MIRKINKIRGQAALIMILLSAAALIFLAITINWGRIAQTKTLLSIAADEGASLLASDAASYGEMEKHSYLKNQNNLTESTSIFVAIFLIILTIIVSYLCPAAGPFMIALDIAAIALAVINLILQVVVVQPGITALWNRLQKNQPIQQQFYEGGIVTGLQNSVTDQVNITDYFDSNTNGLYGANASGVPYDTVSRFALFYTDRLKMLNQPLIPQVEFFYNQLNEFINGQTCGQSQLDNYNFGLSVDPNCQNADVKPFNGPTPCTISTCTTPGINCILDPIDPVCQTKIPNGFQLSDACTNSPYNPYCDPCCQPAATRPSSCSGTSQCLNNNPYGTTSANPFTLLYDPTYQNYAAGKSFLAQLGRDQPYGTSVSGLSPQGNFPNGVFPFFWLMNDYSPEVDTINPTTTPLSATSPALHWCAPATQAANGVDIPTFTSPTGYTDLTQLGTPSTAFSLPYTCQGQDCCVNYLDNNIAASGAPAVSASVPANGVIDMVGSPSFPYQSSLYNPAQDPSFGESGAGTWLQGDNQMCTTNWPYNGANQDFPDGTCMWTNGTNEPTSATPSPNFSTVDSLDDTMHTLSDFLNFSNSLLSKDIGTLSSTFTSWYTQVEVWIAPNNACADSYGNSIVCSAAANGRLNPLVKNLSAWETVMTSWLSQSFTSSNATNATQWCVPTETALLNGNSSTAEDTYIKNNVISTYGDTTGPWGDLPHVMSCLNYNASQTSAGTPAVSFSFNGLTVGTSAYNYQQCLKLLNAGMTADGYGGSSTCPTSLVGTVCDPAILGRSLAGPAPTFTPGSTTNGDGSTTPNNSACDTTIAGSYANWVQNSYTLAADEAPKFTLRAAYLADVYSKAQSMVGIFSEGLSAIQNFLKPCGSSDTACQTGGPAAQLNYLGTTCFDGYGNPLTTCSASSSATFPNSVIYGWVDNGRNGQPGNAHIVKVTVYSPGRTGSSGIGVQSLLPWIQTKTKSFLGLPTSRSYTLVSRDGPVYVSIKRWDADHNPITFPNGHELWRTMFHNPKGGEGAIKTSTDLPQACNGLILPSSSCSGSNGSLTCNIGYGLVSTTVSGLVYAGISATDQRSLANAFMLNDRGDGKTDPYASSTSTGTTGSYSACLEQVNQLLDNAPESHACAEYVASTNAAECAGGATNCSGLGDGDYSLKFFPCSEIGDDLTDGE